MKSVSRYEQLNPNPALAGYSDIRLWPCYVVFTGAILFFSPYITLFGSMIIFGTIAYFIAQKAIKIQKRSGNFYTFDPYMLVLERELKSAQPKPATKKPTAYKEPKNPLPQKKYVLASSSS